MCQMIPCGLTKKLNTFNICLICLGAEIWAFMVEISGKMPKKLRFSFLLFDEK